MSWKGFIEGNIPVKGLTQWREDSTLSYKQTIEGLNVVLDSRLTGSLRSRQIDPIGLLEMTKNPSFADTLIEVGGKLFALTIQSTGGSLDAPDLYTLNLGFGKAKRTLYSLESNDIEVHNRWKYLILEDFDTDGAWVASMPSSWDSEGYGRQEQDIPWEIKSGTWGVNDTYGLIGPSDPDPTSLECQAAGYVYAGHSWWSDYEFSIRFRTDLSTDRVGIRFRSDDEEDNFYLWYWNTTTNLSLRKTVNGASSTIGDTTETIVEDIWNHMRVVCQGHRLKGYLNDVLIFDVVDDSISSGRIGIYSSADNVYFEDCQVILLPPESLNIPANMDWIDQYAHKSINTAFGTQRKLIAPEDNIEFKASKTGEDCILYLPMNEGEGTPIDQSKNNFDISLTGGEWVKDREKGWVLEWDGTDTEQVLVTMGSDAHIRYTIDFEVRADVFQYAYAVCFTGLDPLWYIGGSPASWSWYFTGNARFDNPEANMNLGQWYRVTFLVDSVDDWVECFLDGELIGRITHADINDLGDAAVAIGSNISAGTQPWTGAIRELRVFDTLRWDVALGFDNTPSTVFVWDDYGKPGDSDCALLLRMDEGSGSTVYDASGKGHDSSSWTNTPVYADTSFRGDAGSCLDFDNDDVVNFAHHADFHSSTFSIGMWIQFKSLPTTSTYKEIFRKDNAWIIRVSTDALDESNIDFHIYDGVDYEPSINGQIALTTGVWYYIVATFDGTQQHLYIDTVEDVDATPGTTFAPSGTNAIVLGSQGGSGSMGCYLDEVRFHQRALSADEIASRYRSEPYLHDIYSMTRAYHESHPFEGLPVITNGLIMLDFPAYDTYEYRSADILWPCIYGWFENSWHFLGTIAPTIYANAYQSYIGYYTSSDWEIEELTDQHCKIRITYYKNNVDDWPEDMKFHFWITIRNGFPGVIVEFDTVDPFDEGNTGLMFRSDYGYGTGREWRFLYVPKDNFVDAFFAGASGNVTLANSDDNWAIMFHDKDRSNAPSKNVIMGIFKDTMTGDITNSIYWGDGQDMLGNFISYDHKYGGIFFVPYDVDKLFMEAEDEQALGHHSGATISDQGDDSGTSVELDALTEYVYWELGALEKGSHMAKVRLKHGGTSGEIARVEIRHTTHDGTLVATEDFTVTTSYLYYDLPFHVADSIAGNTFFIKVIYQASDGSTDSQVKTVATSESGWTGGDGKTYNNDVCRTVTPSAINQDYFAYTYGFDWTGVGDINGVEIKHHTGNLTGWGLASFGGEVSLCNATTRRGVAKTSDFNDEVANCAAAVLDTLGNSTDMWGLGQTSLNTYVKGSDFGANVRHTTGTEGEDTLYEDGFQITVWYDLTATLMYVDYFVCIPLNNAIDNPSNLAHQSLKEVDVRRAWKGRDDSAYKMDKG